MASCRWTFQGVPGVFVDYAEQSKADPSKLAVTLPGLGLLGSFNDLDYSDRTNVPRTGESGPWEHFQTYLKELNHRDPQRTVYKLLYITRHGLGFHNLFEAQVGREAWNDHWSHLDGNGVIVWADSHLNQEGIKQAQDLGAFWLKLTTTEKVPLPLSVYSSPLARALQTTKYVFEPAFKANGAHFQPIVKELLRERLTDHTCDRRSTRSWITENFPQFTVEPSLTERDTLWTGNTWETQAEHDTRKYELLQDIFESDDANIIALTTHSYAISSILNVLKMQHFRVKEGSCIAVLVRGDRVST